MSVYITIVTAAGNTYRVADHSGEHDGVLFRGRIQNAPTVEARARATDQGNAVRELPVVLGNHDQYIPLSDPLWGAIATVEVSSLTDTIVGEVKRWSQDNNDSLSLSITEDTLAAFRKLLPDETLRTTDVSYANIAASAANKAVPMVFGGTAAAPIRVKGQVLDRRTSGGNTAKYIVCSGEIRQIVKVWKDGVELASGFTAYTGTAGQALYPGFAYLDFAADPRDASGRWPEIVAEVVGLKLGAATEDECRNPARIIQYVLTTADTGPCGWGLGVDAGDLDATAFATAITDCATAGFKIDGALFDQKKASWWLDQMLKACRGAITFESGKWVLRIDKDSASVKTYTANSTGANNMVVDAFGLGSSSDRKNRIVVDYHIDPAHGNFLSAATRDDSTGFKGSQDMIGVNQRREGLYLVADDVTANKVADYWDNWEKYSEDQIKFRTIDFDAGIRGGQVITLNDSTRGLISALYRITFVSVADLEATIIARSYSASIFGTTAPTTPTVPPVDPTTQFAGAAAAPPGVPSGLTLTTGTRIQADGTLVAYIDGLYTSGAGALVVKVEVGEGASPGSYATLCATLDGAFHYEPAKPGQLYTFRLTSYNAAGNSSSITGSVTAGADSTAPGTPAKPTVTVAVKWPRVRCWQNAVKAPDLASFIIYRSETDNSATATEEGRVACAGNDDGVVFVDEGAAYSKTYYYWTKAIDCSGNVSTSFSPVGDAVTTVTVGDSDVAVGTLTGDRIKVNTLDADRIVASSITSDKITSTGWITGKKFTTADNVGNGSTAGVIFDTAGVRGYSNASSTPTFNLCAATGVLTATGVNISGTITATTGVIGAFTVNTHLYTGSKTAYNDGNAGVHLGSDGIGLGAGVFTVSAAGAMTATSGCIGGWTIGATSLTGGNATLSNTGYGSFGTGNDIAVISAADATYRFWAGNATAASAPFSVTKAGAITATSGTIGGFTITPIYLCSCVATLAPIACVGFGLFSGNDGVGGSRPTLCMWAVPVADLTSMTRSYMCPGLFCNYSGISTDYAFSKLSSTQFCMTTRAASVETAYMCYYGGVLCTSHAVTAGTFVCAGTSFHANAGHTSTMVLGSWGHWAQITDGTATRILFGTSRAGPSPIDCAYIDVYNQNGAGGTRVGNGGVQSPLLYATTYVIADGDVYSGGWGRFKGWNANSGSLSGAAVEIGFSGGISYLQSCNRDNSTYCPIRLDGLAVCSVSPFIATINCSGGVNGLFLACNSNTTNGAYASIALCAGSCVAQLWVGNQNATSWNGAGGLNVYANGAVSLWGSGSEQLRSTSSCVSVYVNLHASCQVKSTATYGVIALNGTLPGYGAMCYPTLCSSTAIYLSACGYYAGYFENQSLCVFGNVWAAAHCTSSSRSLKCCITDLPPMLPLIRNMNVQAWQRINGDGSWGIGVMAEDFQTLYPWWGNGRGVPQMDQLAIRGIQELDTRVTDELAAMRRCINDLEKRLPAAA